MMYGLIDVLSGHRDLHASEGSIGDQCQRLARVEIEHGQRPKPPAGGELAQALPQHVLPSACANTATSRAAPESASPPGVGSDGLCPFGQGAIGPTFPRKDFRRTRAPVFEHSLTDDKKTW